MDKKFDLNNRNLYNLVLSFELPFATTFGNTQEGKRDEDKREKIRKIALAKLPDKIPGGSHWAFWIFVSKPGARRFDIENVPKLIIDAFCRRQIKDDGSKYRTVGLYNDDTIDDVKIVLVGGERGTREFTKVKIYRAVN